MFNQGDLVENMGLDIALGVVMGHVIQTADGEDYYLRFYAEYGLCMVWAGSRLNLLSSSMNYLTD